MNAGSKKLKKWSEIGFKKLFAFFEITMLMKQMDLFF